MNAERAEQIILFAPLEEEPAPARRIPFAIRCPFRVRTPFAWGTQVVPNNPLQQDPPNDWRTAELNRPGPMLTENPYLGFLFRCYSGPNSPEINKVIAVFLFMEASESRA